MATGWQDKLVMTRATIASSFDADAEAESVPPPRTEKLLDEEDVFEQNTPLSPALAGAEWSMRGNISLSLR